LCLPVCPSTGVASEQPCHDSCYVAPGVPVKYAEYISHRSFAWKNGTWVKSPATVDLHLREGGNQWSATFECWDSQTGPMGFPICHGSDKLPDQIAVWQVIACPDGDPGYGSELATSQTDCGAALSSKCKVDVEWAMTTGVIQSPEWYPGLTAESTWAEFQSFIHKELGSCPKPCPIAFFHPVDGGVDRVCRGEDSSDNSKDYYRVKSADSVKHCQGWCMISSGCRGIEYRSSGRCEVWVRPHGIGASNAMPNFSCFRYSELAQEVLFKPVDGATDRVCRGSSASDNSKTYFMVVRASSLESCKAHCVAAAVCKGIEYAAAAQRCEIWYRPDGIQSSSLMSGHECWRLDG